MGAVSLRGVGIAWIGIFNWLRGHSIVLGGMRSGPRNGRCKVDEVQEFVDIGCCWRIANIGGAAPFVLVVVAAQPVGVGGDGQRVCRNWSPVGIDGDDGDDNDNVITVQRGFERQGE